MDSQDDIAAVNIEIFVYKVVLYSIILPIFGVIAPIFFVQQAVVEGYRFIRRNAFVMMGISLPQVEQIRFEGNSFYHWAGFITLALMVIFIVRYQHSIMNARLQRRLPDASSNRRFRDIPASLHSRIEERFVELWQKVGGLEGAPDILCFASTGLAACVTERNARPAIALSTGLIDHITKSDGRLGDAILLHELAHVIGNDNNLFRRSAAFVDAFRLTFIIFISAMAATFLVSSVGEIWNLGGVEQRSPSPQAFMTNAIREIIFPYASMILILRYITLIIVLTELRADLHAAIALGGLATFAATIRNVEGFRPSSRFHIVRSWIGIKISHLPAQERLDLLERQDRLLTPKYRYFAASIALSVLLLMNGSLLFSDFDWVLQIGIISTIAAVNAITVSMATALVLHKSLLATAPRLAMMTLIVVASNMLFLFSPTAVMGTTNEMIVAYTDPNFAYKAHKLQEAYDAWYDAAWKPAADAVAGGRVLAWIIVVFSGLLLLNATWPGPGRRVASIGSGLAAALATLFQAAGAPFATYLLLPKSFFDARDPIRTAMIQCGPVLPIVVGTAIGLLIIACKRKYVF